MSCSSSEYVSCSLEPEEGAAISSIQLLDMEDIPIGRTPKCAIDDARVSRIQVILTADLSKGEVTVKRIGKNPSFLNGSCLELNQSYKAQNNNILELCENGYKYRISFVKSENCAVENDMSTKELLTTTDMEPLAKRAKVNSDGCKQEPYELQWNQDGSLLFCKYGPIDDFIQTTKKKSQAFRIAAFDLDGTIIRTKSGATYPKDPTDWIFWDKEVPSALRNHHQNGFLIVLMTNQASLRFNNNVPGFKSKLEAILNCLNIPMIVLIATLEDFNRKPAPGMWLYLRDHILEDCECSVENSFYVGDAAGRIANWKPGKKKDFSISDRLFAGNIQIRFQTPEAHFLGEKEGEYAPPSFIPSECSSSQKYVESICDKFESPEFQVIMMVGLPASGKSTFVRNHIVPKGFAVVNRDTIGSAPKCEKLLETLIRARMRVVVDNTNVDVQSRKRLINICKMFNVVPKCVVMDCSFKRAQHNNRFRIVSGSDHGIVPIQALRLSSSKFVAPTVEEGFSEVLTVPFVPSFKNEEDRKLYNYHLLDPK